MDGRSRTVLHSTSLSNPIGITLDYETQTLYWVDITLNKIEKSDVNGSNRAVVTTTSIQNPYYITFYDGKLYWTDTYYDRILSTTANTPSSVTFVSTTLNAPYGIEAVSKDRQPEGMTSPPPHPGMLSHLTICVH